MRAGRAGGRPCHASNLAGTGVNLQPLFVDSLSAMNDWQANSAGLALVAAGLLICVRGYYAPDRHMRVMLRVACIALGTAMTVGGPVPANW